MPCARLSGRFPQAAAGCELFLIGGLFLDEAFFGPCFHDFFGFGESGDAVFTALDFFGNGEPVLERSAVGIFGFLKEFGDLLACEFHLLKGVAIAHGAVFAGVGKDLGAVDGDGDVADLQNFGTGGEFENLMEGFRKQVLVFAAEFADRVVGGMGVAGEEAHGDVLKCERLDAPAGEGASRVTINEQAQHHGGRVLGVTRAALIGPRTTQVQRFDRIHDEVDHMVLRNPVAQVGWEK